MAIVCFDVTSKQTAESCKRWIDDVKESAPKDIIFVLCATKLDLREEAGAVTRRAGESLAKQLRADYYFETSAKDNIGLDDMFRTIAQDCDSKFFAVVQQRQRENSLLRKE